MKFKVGDKVECVKTYGSLDKGGVGYVERIDSPASMRIIREDGALIAWVDGKCLKKIGETMTKYEDLKQRIEALENGWDKEADDILEEIAYTCRIFIRCGDDNKIGFINHTSNYIEIDTKGSGNKEFNYKSQCEKMTAFKQALLWLLDNSNIPKVDKKKQEKIEKLEIRIEEEAQRVLDLQEELDELKKK